MTEILPVDQKPTESDGDANGEIFVVFGSGSKLLRHWSARVQDVQGAIGWARTGFDPPKRSTRIVYGEPCSFISIGPGCAFCCNGTLYIRDLVDAAMTGISIGTSCWKPFTKTDIVTPVTFE